MKEVSNRCGWALACITISRRGIWRRKKGPCPPKVKGCCRRRRCLAESGTRRGMQPLLVTFIVPTVCAVKAIAFVQQRPLPVTRVRVCLFPLSLSGIVQATARKSARYFMVPTISCSDRLLFVHAPIDSTRSCENRWEADGVVRLSLGRQLFNLLPVVKTD